MKKIVPMQHLEKNDISALPYQYSQLQEPTIDPEFQTAANGVGFAIPFNRVRVIVAQILEGQR